MKYIKKYEKIGEINPPLKIGNNWAQYMIGLMLDKNNLIHTPYVINFLEKKDIKYRLLYKPTTFLILLDNYEDTDKLPLEPDAEKYDEDDRWFPFDDDGNNGFGVTHFYKDIIDEFNWFEIKIENKDDYDEFLSIIYANNYNI